MSDTNETPNRPTHTIFQVLGDGEKATWLRVGAAWLHQDMRTAHASIAPELVDIAITLHRLGSGTREAGLEIFERLLAINAYMARETLDQVDNRFRSSQVAARRRLPRRTARPRRARRSRAA